MWGCMMADFSRRYTFLCSSCYDNEFNPHSWMVEQVRWNSGTWLLNSIPQRREICRLELVYLRDYYCGYWVWQEVLSPKEGVYSLCIAIFFYIQFVIWPYKYERIIIRFRKRIKKSLSKKTEKYFYAFFDNQNLLTPKKIKNSMYFDLSVLSTNLLDLSHLLRSLPGNSIGSVAIDYQCSDCAIPPLPDSFNKLKQSHPQIRLYSRATLSIENTATLHQLAQHPPYSYDIIAVRPKNQKVFHALCVEYENYDVISLDCRVKLPFMLKRNPVYEALRKGKYFQLQYAPIFEDASRVVCMTNFINIIKATNSKNLIITSHSDHWRTHRSPYDVAALLSSLGMEKELALNAMKDNAEQVLRSGAHRIFFKGTIRQISEVTVRKLGKRIRKHREGINKIAKGLSIPQ